MPSRPSLQVRRKTVRPSLNEDTQRYTHFPPTLVPLMEQLIFEYAALCLLLDELYRSLAQFDQHPSPNSSLLEQVQDNCRYRCKSECAGALAGAEALAP